MLRDESGQRRGMEIRPRRSDLYLPVRVVLSVGIADESREKKMDERTMKIGTWSVVGMAVVFLASPAQSATPGTEVREAVARLNSLRDQFQTSGVMPAAKDLEAVE